MKFSVFSIFMVSAGCLVLNQANAFVNESGKMSAQATAAYTAPIVQIHHINDIYATTPLAAGYISAYTLVGTGTVETSVPSKVAVRPAEGYKNTNTGYVQSRDILAIGETDTTKKILLSISSSPTTNVVPTEMEGWSIIGSDTANTSTYYVQLNPLQTIEADTYKYIIDATSYVI
ncbi:hypothetical protein [Enterobacter cloacae]|uniref:hypothetical protein n=1 Tax=Enterobacter cloacae TaxID=550 RepID=UPI002A37D9A0|nr:hypothetical protein [Enterobacter cloacae]